MSYHDLQDIPLPKGISVLLFCGVGVATYIHTLSHDQISFGMSVILFFCGIISYGHRLLKWIRKHRHEAQAAEAEKMRHRKTGGKQ